MSALAVACLAAACGETKHESSATPATGATPGPVDACAFMPRDRVEAQLGELEGAPRSLPGEATLLSTCRQRLAGDHQITLTVRALTDFSAMAAAGTQLAGLGEQAFQTQAGVFLKLAGQPHFFHIVITGPTGLEVEKSIELAKIIAATAQ